MSRFTKTAILCLVAALFLVFSASALAEPVEITIFHTNDVHGNVDTSSGMGYAMAAAYVNAMRAESENVLLFDVGDVFHGLPFANMTEGDAIVDILNAMEYDAWVPGNHDYNYGMDRLIELSQMLTFPTVLCNLSDDDGNLAFQPYTIIETGGAKIGVIGVDAPALKLSMEPKSFGEYELTDGIEAVAAAAREIADSTDAIVVLCHWGYTGEDPSSAALAQIPGVDLVIDGHTHEAFENGVQVEGGALIVSTGEHLNNLGVVRMVVNEGGVTELTASLIPDPEVYSDQSIEQMIKVLREEYDEVASEVLTTVDVRLEGEREALRTQETNLSNLVTDAVMEKTGADMVMLNAGTFRISIEPGDLTRGDVATLMPYGNIVQTVYATGEQIVAALENGLSQYPGAFGGFPLIAGGAVTADMSKESGERVMDVSIDGEAIDAEKSYTLAIIDYMYNGGDSYAMLTDCEKIADHGALDEIVVSYIAAGNEIPTEPEGRLTIIE